MRLISDAGCEMTKGGVAVHTFLPSGYKASMYYSTSIEKSIGVERVFYISDGLY